MDFLFIMHNIFMLLSMNFYAIEHEFLCYLARTVYFLTVFFPFWISIPRVEGETRWSRVLKYTGDSEELSVMTDSIPVEELAESGERPPISFATRMA